MGIHTVDRFRGHLGEDVQTINRDRAPDMHRQQHCVSMVNRRPGCACKSLPAKALKLKCTKIHQPDDAGCLQYLSSTVSGLVSYLS